MKVFLAIFTALLIIIPAHNLKAQATHSLNIDKDIPYSLYDIKFGPTNSAKANIPIDQIYLPDTLIIYSMSDTLRMSASYDPRGWNDQILVQVWFSGHWVNYERRTWTALDSTTQSNLTLKQRWLNGQWQNSELDSSTYDANGNMLVHLYKYWFQGAWKDSILSSRTYDANGNMLTNVGWYMINNQWTNHDRSTYTYDANGNMLTYLFEWWTGQWVNMDQSIYTYDENGHMLTRLTQVWNGQWENATLSTYTYDANGNMLSYLLQISANGQWTNYTLHTYTYDANGKMLTDWLKAWTNGAWMNGSLTTYTYDTNGNMVNELIQEWLNGQWTNYRQSTFTYDEHGNELTGNNTLWSGSSWVPTDYNFQLAVSGSTYNFTGYRIIISWILVNTTDVPADISNIVKDYSLSQNYPNPFNPSTTFRYSIPNESKVIIKVYDILGKEIETLVNEEKPTGTYEIIWIAANLPSGVYFYQIQVGNFIQTRKLVLLK